MKYIFNLEIIGLVIVLLAVYVIGFTAGLETLHTLMYMFVVTVGCTTQAIHYHIRMHRIRKDASQQLQRVRKEASKNIQDRDDAYWELYDTVKGDLENDRSVH